MNPFKILVSYLAIGGAIANPVRQKQLANSTNTVSVQSVSPTAPQSNISTPFTVPSPLTVNIHHLM